MCLYESNLCEKWSEFTLEYCTIIYGSKQSKANLKKKSRNYSQLHIKYGMNVITIKLKTKIITLFTFFTHLASSLVVILIMKFN